MKVIEVTAQNTCFSYGLDPLISCSEFSNQHVVMQQRKRLQVQGYSDWDRELERMRLFIHIAFN